jgi:hypothetical protein
MLSPELLTEYVNLRITQITGEEKLFHHDCCRRSLVDELLDLLNLVEEQNGVEQEEENLSV